MKPKIPHGCKFGQGLEQTEESICFSLGKTVLGTKPNELCLACIERERERERERESRFEDIHSWIESIARRTQDANSRELAGEQWPYSWVSSA